MPTSITDPLASGSDLAAATRGRIKADDPWVTEAIAAASEAVRNVCGWHIAPQVTETLTLDGEGGNLLFLPSKHVTAISAVTAAGETVDVAELEWSRYGVVECRGSWPRKRRGITVTLTHGHAEVPAAVLALVTEVASRGILAARAAGVKREQSGSSAIEFSTLNGVPITVDVLEHELMRLRPYILPGRA